MSTPTHACLRCGQLTPEPGACPAGHGLLVDLSDGAERAEAEALVAVYSPRSGAAWLLGEAALFVLLSGWLVALGADLLDALNQVAWSEGAASLTLSVGVLLGLLTWQGWRQLRPRHLQARRLRRALARVPAPAPRLEARPLPEVGEPEAPLPHTDPTDREAASRTRKRREEADRRRKPKKTGAYSIM